MDVDDHEAAKARTGVPGLDDVLSGGLTADMSSCWRETRDGKDDDSAALPAGRGGGRREMSLHHAVGNRAGAARRGRFARLDNREKH